MLIFLGTPMIAATLMSVASLEILFLVDVVTSYNVISFLSHL